MVNSLRLRVTLILIAIGLTLAGCQTATTVGALNECGTDVEVQADSVSTFESERWVGLSPGERDDVVDVEESAETLYVRVRAADGDQVHRFDVPMGDLGTPPEDADYEAELDLRGDRCP